MLLELRSFFFYLGFSAGLQHALEELILLIKFVILLGQHVNLNILSGFSALQITKGPCKHLAQGSLPCRAVKHVPDGFHGGWGVKREGHSWMLESSEVVVWHLKLLHFEGVIYTHSNQKNIFLKNIFLKNIFLKKHFFN
jgi:hypothetical protein